MPESKVPFSSCPLCGANAYEAETLTRADGTSSEGWFRCIKCRKYAVNLRAAEPHVPKYMKPYR